MIDAPTTETQRLEITKPANGQVMVGNAPIEFQGRIVGAASKTLYYKWHLPDPEDTWYFPENDPKRQVKHTTLKTKAVLGVGTHIITLAAKDVPTDAATDLAQAETVLLAGGGESIPGMQTPCIIHVLFAQMIWTPPAPYQLSRKRVTLYAQAASKWGKKNNGQYEVDPDYQKINRLKYQWTLTPRGEPAKRKSATIKPEANNLGFAIVGDANDKKNGKLVQKAVVSYQKNLTDEVDTGSYTLTLRVEDQQNGETAHEVSQQVEVI